MKNHFQLFQIEPRYQLDMEELNKCYLQLQKRFHPDKYINASRQEKELAERMSAQCNLAYKLLSDPLSRAAHLLEIHSIEEAKEVSPELLMQQMEINEEIENSSDPEQLQALKSRIEQELARINQGLSEAFDQQRPADQQAAILLQKLQFYSRLQSTLKSRGSA